MLQTENVTLSHAAKRIYFEAFPKEERMPFPMMVAMSKLWSTDFWAFYDDDALCGFVYTAHNPHLLFIMFLAVDRALRSQGYGSAILREVRRKHPKKSIVVTIEPCDPGVPDLALREKRKSFYLRNGFEETGYRIKLGGAAQEILIANGVFSKAQFRLFLALYSNGVMWPKIWKP
jgi:GNAT superfamily N-acetyltransferase